MQIYCLEVPILSVYSKEIFYKQLYFSTHPTKETIISACDKMIAEAEDIGGIDDEAIDVKKVVESVEHLPSLEGRIVSTNIFVETPLGRKPLILSIIDVYE